MIRRDIDSPHRWYGESLTPRIGEPRFAKPTTQRIEDSGVEESITPALMIRGVGDSVYLWYGESLFELNFNRALNLKRLNHAVKGPIWQKISRRCNVLSLLVYLKVWRLLLVLVDSPIMGVVFRLRISPRISQNPNCSKVCLRDLCHTGLCKKLFTIVKCLIYKYVKNIYNLWAEKGDFGKPTGPPPQQRQSQPH